MVDRGRRGGWIQNPVRARVCGFKSLLWYYGSMGTRGGRPWVLFLRGWQAASVRGRKIGLTGRRFEPDSGIFGRGRLRRTIAASYLFSSRIVRAAHYASDLAQQPAPMSQKRDHFRIVFPLDQRPCLAAGLAEWDVIDLSENGARVAVSGNTSLCSREAFAATIRFHDGAAGAVIATIQRREQDHVTLSFAEPLAYSLIMAEQRRLLRLFPRDAFSGPPMPISPTIPHAVTAGP
jgi:hypothetical protein